MRTQGRLVYTELEKQVKDGTITEEEFEKRFAERESVLVDELGVPLKSHVDELRAAYTAANEEYNSLVQRREAVERGTSGSLQSESSSLETLVDTALSIVDKVSEEQSGVRSDERRIPSPISDQRGEATAAGALALTYIAALAGWIMHIAEQGVVSGVREAAVVISSYLPGTWGLLALMTTAVSAGMVYVVARFSVDEPVALPVLASPLSLPASSPHFSSLVAALNGDSAVAQRVRRIVLFSNPALRHTALTDYGQLQPLVVQRFVEEHPSGVTSDLLDEIVAAAPLFEKKAYKHAAVELQSLLIRLQQSSLSSSSLSSLPGLTLGTETQNKPYSFQEAGGDVSSLEGVVDTILDIIKNGKQKIAVAQEITDEDERWKAVKDAETEMYLALNDIFNRRNVDSGTPIKEYVGKYKSLDDIAHLSLDERKQLFVAVRATATSDNTRVRIASELLGRAVGEAGRLSLAQPSPDEGALSVAPLEAGEWALSIVDSIRDEDALSISNAEGAVSADVLSSVRSDERRFPSPISDERGEGTVFGSFVVLYVVAVASWLLTVLVLVCSTLISYKHSSDDLQTQLLFFYCSRRYQQ